MKKLIFLFALLFAATFTFGQTISFIRTTGDTITYSVSNIYYIAKRGTGSILVTRNGSQSVRGTESITALLSRAGNDFVFFVDQSLDSTLLNVDLVFSISRTGTGKASIVTTNRLRTFTSTDTFDSVTQRLADVLNGGSNTTLGNIIYVSADAVANTGQKGNPLKPYTTLALAKAQAEDGDLIYVYPGTYAATNLFLADSKLSYYFEDCKINSGSICNATDTGTLIIRGILNFDSVATRAIPITVNHLQAVVDIQVNRFRGGTVAEVYKSKTVNLTVEDLISSSTLGTYNSATKSLVALRNSTSAKGDINVKVNKLTVPSYSATEVCLVGLDSQASLAKVNFKLTTGQWDRIAHTKGALLNSFSNTLTVSNGSKYVFEIGSLKVNNARDSSDLTSGLVGLNGIYDSTTVFVDCKSCELEYFAVAGLITATANATKGVNVDIRGNYIVNDNVGFWVIDGSTGTNSKDARISFDGFLDARDTSAIIAKTDAVDCDYVFSGLIRSEGDDPVFNSSVAVGANGMVLFKDVYLENNGTPAAIASSTAITVRVAGAYQLGSNTDGDVTATTLDEY